MENSSFNLRSQKLYFLLSIQIIFIFFFRTSFNLRSKNVCFLLSIHEIFICSLSICKAKIFICFFQYLIFISFFQSQKSFEILQLSTHMLIRFSVVHKRIKIPVLCTKWQNFGLTSRRQKPYYTQERIQNGCNGCICTH